MAPLFLDVHHKYFVETNKEGDIFVSIAAVRLTSVLKDVVYIPFSKECKTWFYSYPQVSALLGWPSFLPVFARQQLLAASS